MLAFCLEGFGLHTQTLSHLTFQVRGIHIQVGAYIAALFEIYSFWGYETNRNPRAGPAERTLGMLQYCT